MPILMFTGEFDWLSNFYLAPIVVDKIKFASVEHAYQMFKTDDPGWRKKIRNARTPGVAKRLGRECPVRKNWRLMSLNVMRECVRAKFTQNNDLRVRLLATGDEHLEEGNTWGDRFYGTVNGVGDNWLGSILMEIRSELRNQL